MYHLPALNLDQIENMSLLEIDSRVSLIGDIKRSEGQHRLKDLSCIMFYAVSHGYCAVRSKGPIEKQYHEKIDLLLQSKKQDETNNPDNIEAELDRIFKG